MNDITSSRPPATRAGAAVALLLAALLSACGGGGDDPPAAATSSAAATTTAPGVQGPAPTEAASNEPCEVLSAGDLTALLAAEGATETLSVTPKRVARDTCDYAVQGSGGNHVVVQVNARPGDFDDQVSRLGADGVTSTAVAGLGEEAVSFQDVAGENLALRTSSSFVKVSSGFELERTVGSPKTGRELLEAVAEKVLAS